MKLLVISDTHLNLPFSIEKYTILKRIISQSDRVILNGDFWEGYLLRFDQFLKSDWKKLFPMLREKHTIYIYGNHDKQIFSDERTQQFSVKQTNRYMEKIGPYTFIFEHGNRVIPLIDDNRNWNIPPRRMLLVSNLLHKYMIRFFGNTFLQLCFGRLNMRGIKNLKKELHPGEIFVCGHTHAKRLDIPNQFVNSGVSKHGVIQWLWIDENGAISPQEQWYHD